MGLTLKNGQVVQFRSYQEPDFAAIHELNGREGWNNLVKNKKETKNAWLHSNAAFVAEIEDQVVGYVRGLTDQHITLFICELLIQEEFRGLGIGEALLRFIHEKYPETRMDLIASSASRTFYEHHSFRAFYGFRKTMEE
ncbi:MAG TPA: GNAT family N-acetyltransferase [Bacillales bacterium]|nr:GNAT family N-acetyltransferase [Bacillales bacterium]